MGLCLFPNRTPISFFPLPPSGRLPAFYYYYVLKTLQVYLIKYLLPFLKKAAVGGLPLHLSSNGCVGK